MPLVGNTRGDVDYDAIAAENTHFDLLTDEEKSRMRHLFEVLFSADTTYIQGNADIDPTAHTGEDLSSPTGQHSQGSDPQGGVVNSATIEDKKLVGLGRIL